VFFIPVSNKRQRYIGFKLESESNTQIEKKDLFKEIQKICRKKYHRYTIDMGLRLIRFDGTGGIIKCNHIEKDKTISILNSIKRIESHNVKIETLYTSGTIKSLNKKIKK
jgi:RNase P/RNase MRP subunit POP5